MSTFSKLFLTNKLSSELNSKSNLRWTNFLVSDFIAFYMLSDYIVLILNFYVLNYLLYIYSKHKFVFTVFISIIKFYLDNNFKKTQTPAREKDMSYDSLFKNSSEKMFLNLRLQNRKFFETNSKNFQDIVHNMKNRLKQNYNETKPPSSVVYPNAIRNAEERLEKIKDMLEEVEGRSMKPRVKRKPLILTFS